MWVIVVVVHDLGVMTIHLLRVMIPVVMVVDTIDSSNHNDTPWWPMIISPIEAVDEVSWMRHHSVGCSVVVGFVVVFVSIHSIATYALCHHWIVLTINS